MHASELTPEMLAALSKQRPYPAITMVMPTDSDFPYSEKDRILTRDLVTEVKRRLADDPDVDRKTRMDLEELLDPAAIEDAVTSLPGDDAMVVYVAAHEPVQVWRMTSLGPVEPKVEFATAFLTRYLVGAQQRARPYLLLVLDQEMCRLFRGSVNHLTEVKEDGFPDVPRIPSPEDALPGPIPHSPPYEGHDARVKQYLRTINKKLNAYFHAHGTMPLFVIGGPKILAAFEEVNEFPRVVAGTLALTGMENDSPKDLAKRLAPVLAEYEATRVKEAMDALSDARGAHRYAGGAPEVWTAVADNRVRLLLVEEGLSLAGRISEDGREVEVVTVPEPVTLPDPKPDVTAPPRTYGVATDVVERLVDGAIEADSEVMFVPDGTLSDLGGVAAVLRY
ncbi:hypothetical protein ACFQLX_14210 [Streptomyces polyrhachis]|uniref:Uncharacterized protein n=1 Tax=Streptomyces polyrhachis TaxID=1282885 RepID=A0ABW2GF40_9ACTN